MFNPWRNKLLIFCLLIAIDSINSNEDPTQKLELSNQESIPTESPIQPGKVKTLSDKIIELIRVYIAGAKMMSKDLSFNFFAGFIASILLMLVLRVVYRLVRRLACLIWRLLKGMGEKMMPILIKWGPPICRFLRTLGYALWNIMKACWKMLEQKVNGISTTRYFRAYNIERNDILSDMEKNESTENNQVPTPNANTVFVYDRDTDQASIVQ